MTAERSDAQVVLEPGRCEGLVDGGTAQLVTLRLGGTGEVGCTQTGQVVHRPAICCHLRRGEARELAFALLEAAEHAHWAGSTP
jgi:hypothetical protein